MKRTIVRLLCCVCVGGVLGTVSADPPPARYVINTDRVFDTRTGLSWERSAATKSLTHRGAIAYCNALRLEGAVDWRVPTIAELLSIVDWRQDNPAIDQRVFPDTPIDTFWTSSSYRRDPTLAWVVFFQTGRSGPKPITQDHRVRCVR